MNLLHRLAEEGCVLYTIAPVDEYLKFREDIPGLRHYNLEQLSRKGTNPWQDLALYRELKRLYKDIKPDLVIHYTHKPNIYGGLACGRLGIASVGILTGLGYAFIRKGLLSWISMKLYALSARHHRRLVFENEDDKRLFVQQGIVGEDKALAIKGCGVDLGFYKPMERRGAKGPFVFTFIGRLLYDKGIEEFVEAARQVLSEGEDIEFRIIGEFDKGNPSMVNKEKLMAWLTEPRIRYLGFKEDVRPFMAQSDCIVLPSYREGMPRVVLEAMAMSIPVITTDTAGCREAVSDGVNGFLVGVQDSSHLAKAMQKMYALSAEEREKMGAEGLHRARSVFNSEKISQELYEIVSQAYFCG